MFARLTFGGPATGIAFGLATTAWMRFMYNIPMAEITLTIAASFASYLVADQLFHVSGVLAVVMLGESSWGPSPACRCLSPHKSGGTAEQQGSLGESISHGPAVQCMTITLPNSPSPPLHCKCKAASLCRSALTVCEGMSGLWMAAMGKHHISAKVQEPLAVIWEELEYVANTLVFVLSGVIIVGNVYESHSPGQPTYIRGADYAYALLLWAFLLVRLPAADPGMQAGLELYC